MKKFLHLLTLMLVTVFSSSAFIVKDGDEFQLVTSTNDLNTDGTYILCYNQNAMGSQNGTTYRNSVESAITLNGNAATIAFGKGSSISAFKLINGTNSGTYAINAGTEEKPEYLYPTANSTAKLSNKTNADASCNVSITFNSNSEAIITFTSTSQTSGNLIQYNSSSPRFTNYSSTSNQKNCKIYKLNSTTAPDPSGKVDFESFEKSYTVKVGETIDLFNDPNAPTITYTPSSNDYFEIKDNKLTGKNPCSEIMVIATWNENTIYNGGLDDFEVTVTDNSQGGEGGDQWVLVNNTSDLVAGGKYIIAHANGSKYYAMNTTVTSNKIETDVVTVSNNILTPVSSTAIFVIEGTEGKWKLKCENNNQYLNVNSGSGTNLNFNNAGSENSITFEGDYVKIDNTRRVFVNGDVYGSYATSNWGSSGYYKPSLYKFVEASVQLPSKPTLSINGVELEGDSKTVASGTQVTLDCKNAVDWTGYIGEDHMEGKDIPYTFTVTEDIEILVAGLNEDGEEGETLEFNFYVGEADPNAPAVGSNFKEVLSSEELSEDYYVLAKKGDTTFAMSINAGNGNISSTTDVSIKEVGKDTKFSVISNNSDEVLIVRLEQQDEESWYIKTVNLGDKFTTTQKYLSAPNSGSTTLEFSDIPNSAKIEFPQRGSTNAKIKFDEGDRNIVLSTGSGNPFNYQNATGIQIFRYSRLNVYEPVFADIDMTLDAPTADITIEGDEHPAITFTVTEGTDVISIEGNTITAKKAGDAVVTATWDESDKWFGGSVDFNVSVRQVLTNEDFFFYHSIVRGKVGVGVNAQAVHYAGDGNVEYAVYDVFNGPDANSNVKTSTDEIDIDPITGMIRPEKMSGAIVNKIYTVVATLSGSTTYLGGFATYQFKIEAPEVPAPGSSEETFDFNSKSYGMWDVFTSSNTGSGDLQSKYEKDRTDEKDPVSKFEEGTVAIDMTGNYRYFRDPKQLRVHNAATMSFSTSLGKITSIEFDHNADNVIALETGNDGSYKNGIWNSSNSDGTESVKFKFSGTDRINNITVYLKVPAGNKEEANLTFEKDIKVENIFVAEKVRLPKLNFNENLKFEDLDFDIDEINEQDEDETFQNYDIIRNDTEETIDVIVNVPGVYTFRAEYNGKEGSDIAKGFAILRLNVFPHLNVTTDDSNLADDSRNDHPNLTLISAELKDETESVEISLPSVSDLEGGELQFSTIHVDKVTIKHGNDTPVDYEVGKIPPTYPFTQDGSITYKMKYANEDDFFVENTIHVIFMPSIPEWGIDETYQDKILIVPSQNAKLEYMRFETYGSQNPFVPMHPDEEGYEGPQSINARRIVAPDGWTIANEPTTIDLEGGKYAVKFRSVKDLNEITGQDFGDNSTLGSAFKVVGLNSNGVPTSIDSIVADWFDSEAQYFNLQGLKVDRPAKGGIYIKVKGGKSSKVVY